MSVSKGWLRQPQKVWLRRAIFQVHLWTGIIVGLYIVMISVTGAVVVFRRDLTLALLPRTVPITGERMTKEQITQAAQAVYPWYEVTDVSDGRRKDAPVFVSLERAGEKQERQFNPYTGQDIGDTNPAAIQWMEWLVDLHDNLLAGSTGRMVNGIGGIATLLLCMTGIVIWWRGIANWYRGFLVLPTRNWNRVNFDLHSAFGCWSLFFLLIWAVSGIYFGFPGLFQEALDAYEPPTDENYGGRSVDHLVTWLVRMHFGRFGGTGVRIFYFVVGLVPAALFMTGAIMWWNRVLRRWVAAIPMSASRSRGRLKEVAE